MAALTGVSSSVPPAALRHLLDPAVRIVTLTVTEKGYCRDARAARWTDDPAIQRDLQRPTRRHVPGLLAAALRRGARPASRRSPC